MPRTLPEPPTGGHGAALHLVAPALDAGALVALHGAAAVRTVLARGVREPVGDDAASVLLALAGLDAATGRAALARFGAGLDATGCWSAVEPVHLAPTMDSVRLQRLAHELDDREVDALLGAVGEALAEHDARLDVAGRAVRWPRPLALRDPDPAALDGRDARAALDAHRAHAAHLRLELELQMLLHRHPVNQARAARRALAANALWFHGTGELPAAVPRPFAAASGSDALLAGLARAMGIAHRAAPAPDGPGVLRADGAALLGALDAAHAALARGAIAALVLHLPPVGSWRLTRAGRWAVWRRTPDLEALLEAPR
jgi:hypothetical protein